MDSKCQGAWLILLQPLTITVTFFIPYDIIHNKNDWLKSVGYIAA